MSVCREAIHHRPKSNLAYAEDEETVRLRLRAKKGDLDGCQVLHADKFDWANRNLTGLEKVRSDSRFDYWETSVKPDHRRLCYAFLVQADGEELWFTEWGFESKADNDLPTAGTDQPLHYFEYPFINPVDVIDPPEWVADAVFYQIFPERFANGNPDINPDGVEDWGGDPEQDNFFGGDLQGIIENLDYLDDLGITALYLTPIFESTSNHKYNTTDYERIDPHFGDTETLKRLVDAAHDRDMRVMLDAVFNHCGRQFEPFQDVLENGRDSEYVDWFHIHEFPIEFEPRPSYDTFGFESYMPKLNTENSEVKSYLIDVATDWIEETGIDGWRLDVANEVDHEFWREFRRAVKEVKPDAYILGEIWRDSRPWLRGDQFDAVMNYPFTYAADDFLGEQSIDAATFTNKINRFLMRYPEQVNEVLFNLLGSHDTARLKHRYDGDERKVRVALLMLLTFRGTPCLYYGDEIGMTGGEDPDCRRTMVWDEADQNRDLHRYVSDLINMRARHRPLRRGTLSFDRDQCYGDQVVYSCSERDAAERITVGVNRGESPAKIRVPSEATPETLVATTESEIPRDGDSVFELPSMSGAVWK
ncbi:glycoside hydrolase family 13 protein [Saliphagus infecundisoli]|uniref:Glycoside hydrolase family 13 protein n=1 Tax=Saliphagus infecundisoli TaxID=1849069 RepID=A0ABD5QHN4_9EURY|nr:glycoside hydrolase family 13 protein [Saliphagus infecundisoli]